MNGSVDFTREWQDYKEGFGSLDGEFRAGSVTFYPKITHQIRAFNFYDVERML